MRAHSDQNQSNPEQPAGAHLYSSTMKPAPPLQNRYQLPAVKAVTRQRHSSLPRFRAMGMTGITSNKDAGMTLCQPQVIKTIC